MFSEAPPSREEVTTSRTCADSVEVKTFTTSGMMAPARVPQVMMVESFHHKVPSPAGPRLGISSVETRYVMPTETREVTQTSWVRGFSKFILSAVPKRALTAASLIRKDRPLATIIMMRIMKIHTSSCTCTLGSLTASRMKVMSATPVTP